ncbi:hypothetical protein [Actinoplanes octamycinicus]|uniref:hypothetical protein n=1 Tax=Actinoplanes octamycinicus TaxID=135948 RepID=UPI00160F7203|nr:hypothetical protein [Actinoplanes octamycinicus]
MQEKDARRFWRNLEDAVAQTRPGQPVPGLSSIEGSDNSGTVYCVVDLGGDPIRVELFNGWWDTVGPTRVGPAVLDAFRFAREKAGLASLLLRRHRLPRRGPRRRLEVATLMPAFGASDGAAELRRSMVRAADQAEAVLGLVEASRGGRRREVHGPRGLFSVTMDGWQITSAAVIDRVRADDGEALAMDACDALLAACPRKLR